VVGFRQITREQRLLTLSRNKVGIGRDRPIRRHSLCFVPSPNIEKSAAGYRGHH
jgi:hypothetical protein